MQMVEDDVAWTEAYLDTPFSMEKRPSSEGEAMLMPPCCVKSKELADRWPKHTGILVSLDKVQDVVIVRGHNSPVSPRFVWTGTVREYFAFWECD